MARSVRYFVKGRLQETQEQHTRSAQRGIRYRDGCSKLINSNTCHCTILDDDPDPLCPDCIGTGIRNLSKAARKRLTEY